MRSFCEVVSVLRVRAGYATARAFHRAWCRRIAQSCSYKAYCEIEAGRLIPSPAVAARLAAALSVRPGTREADEFRASYLLSATHSPSLARALLSALRPERESSGIADRVLHVGMMRKRHVLTDEQRILLMEHPEIRPILIALHASSQPEMPETLAAALGTSAPDAHRALRRLVAVGLARKQRSAYVCPQADRALTCPRPTRKEIDNPRLSFFSGFPVLKGFPSSSWSRQYVVFFRANSDVAAQLARRAESMVNTAGVLHRRAGKGSIFSVEAFIYRMYSP